MTLKGSDGRRRVAHQSPSGFEFEEIGRGELKSFLVIDPHGRRLQRAAWGSPVDWVTRRSEMQEEFEDGVGFG
jgi:hypothetical protein